MMWLIVSILFGSVLGLILAWAYSAREAQRRLKRLDPFARLPIALVVSRVLSIVLGVLVAMASNLTILLYQPGLLNEIAYFCCTLGVAIGAWKFVLKPKTDMRNTHDPWKPGG